MRSATAGAIGGLVAGAVISGVLFIGRDAGWLKPTLADRGEDWLDETFGARERFGDEGTELISQAGHYAASLGLGAAYGAFRPYVDENADVRKENSATPAAAKVRIMLCFWTLASQKCRVP